MSSFQHRVHRAYVVAKGILCRTTGGKVLRKWWHRGPAHCRRTCHAHCKSGIHGMAFHGRSSSSSRLSRTSLVNSNDPFPTPWLPVGSRPQDPTRPRREGTFHSDSNIASSPCVVVCLPQTTTSHTPNCTSGASARRGSTRCTRHPETQTVPPHPTCSLRSVRCGWHERVLLFAPFVLANFMEVPRFVLPHVSGRLGASGPDTRQEGTEPLALPTVSPSLRSGAHGRALQLRRWTCPTPSTPARVDSADCNGAHAASTCWLNCIAKVLATNLRNVVPVAMPLTPPSFFCRAVKVARVKQWPTPRGTSPQQLKRFWVIQTHLQHFVRASSRSW